MVVCFLATLLSGCGEGLDVSQGKKDGNNSSASVPVQEFSKNSIGLDRGQSLSFEGRIVRYDLIRSERGAFDRYSIESAKSLMGLEASVFNDLARKGYTRSVRQETPERFLVHYLQKGRKTVVADFRAKDGLGKLQRLIVTVPTEG